MKRLLVFDFDGTVADTFTQSAGGMGVEQAVAHSLRDVLGEEAECYFLETGGLRNRAPSELIEGILSRGNCLGHARKFFDNHAANLSAYVPEGKGVPLEWVNGSSVGLIVELFVRRKLEIFSDHISDTPSSEAWPQPIDGFCEFWKGLGGSSEAVTAILSSGHDFFIEKFFRLWSLPQPDFLLTDDDMRARVRCNLPVLEKPNPLLFTCLKRLVEAKVGQCEIAAYYGDSLEKDGEMAQRAGIPFFWQRGQHDPHPDIPSFSDWGEL